MYTTNDSKKNIDVLLSSNMQPLYKQVANILSMFWVNRLLNIHSMSDSINLSGVIESNCFLSKLINKIVLALSVFDNSLF